MIESIICATHAIRVGWGQLAFTLDAITNSGKSLAQLVKEADVSKPPTKKAKVKAKRKRK